MFGPRAGPEPLTPLRTPLPPRSVARVASSEASTRPRLPSRVNSARSASAASDGLIPAGVFAKFEEALSKKAMVATEKEEKRERALLKNEAQRALFEKVQAQRQRAAGRVAHARARLHEQKRAEREEERLQQNFALAEKARRLEHARQVYAERYAAAHVPLSEGVPGWEGSDFSKIWDFTLKAERDYVQPSPRQFGSAPRRSASFSTRRSRGQMSL